MYSSILLSQPLHQGCSFPARGRTCVLLRFSTIAGEAGSSDARRDVRGFAPKLYTVEASWDLVDNGPVLFLRDPVKFPCFIGSQKRLGDKGPRDRTMHWGFWMLSPETAQQVPTS